MTMDFRVEGSDGEGMNLANDNARSLLEWLGYAGSPWDIGRLPAADVAARCRRRLWPEGRNHDQGAPGSDTKLPGKPRVIDFGRREGYLEEKTAALLALATEAGPTGFITVT